ncbi:hypothetical protein [Nocardia seriolae]|uniref:hypothetical protein n=1 Tax=Nocardia seriolae TaxID=37332 RepID=UPI0004B90D6C|nr:hypothetical protein [Nocardia seriolae]MTJ61993.1 hypothetical protein [Nocardia seriolae]MTJ71130.1 hypothetical protein [Nocardia seriolae]MTJ89981.1 hypothetical protein [Nocardia seriolae]MTK33955.1 hypothetical protein [Nocardia seriolae]MTK39943.1 hypothetical protein [Nocardia seriolae]
MGTVLLIALGVLCFVTGPALALVIVQAVRRSAREAAGRRAPARRDAERIPVAGNYGQRR